MALCELCPRRCRANRDISPSGFCRSPALPVVVRAAPHCWEEPCISGERGSGAIFFAGCNLRCVYCQNAEISREAVGKTLDVPRLRELMLRLRDGGAHNINLVTPTHYTAVIAEALSGLRLDIPVVWNSSGYESVDSLRLLEGLVQIYMPDMKYSLGSVAEKLSAAPDYPLKAAEAISEMYRQTGDYRLEGGLLKSGVLIRHLVLPGETENSYGVIDWVSERFTEGQVLFSLMGQYTPNGRTEAFPELCRPLSSDEYDAALHYLKISGISDGFTQELTAADAGFVPEFDERGI